MAFSVTRASLWDAARIAVGDRDGDGRLDYTRVDAFYRPAAQRWRQSVRYSQHALQFLSGYLGIPYPWPHMTAVEAAEIIGGGMEYPMMTLIGDYNAATDSALYFVTAHEEGHMWFPMLVSTDERRYSWLDEGTTTFNENQARNDFFPGQKHELGDQNQYLQVAQAEEEGEIMRWDMWNTFESVSGQDLDWFWSAWYQTTWTLDQAVTSVTTAGGHTTITIEDKGRVPMPVTLVITRANGQTERRAIPVDVWLPGATSTTTSVAATDVTRVEIDPERNFPDLNRRNNTWTR